MPGFRFPWSKKRAPVEPPQVTTPSTDNGIGNMAQQGLMGGIPQLEATTEPEWRTNPLFGEDLSVPSMMPPPELQVGEGQLPELPDTSLAPKAMPTRAPPTIPTQGPKPKVGRGRDAPTDKKSRSYFDSSLKSEGRHGSGKEKMKDRHVGRKHGKSGVAKSANDVRSVEYKRNIGTSGENRGFFKGFAKKTGSDLAGVAGIGTTKDGENSKDPRLGARAVGSSRLDRALGLNVLSEEVFSKHGGKRGTTSARVAGNELMTTKFNNIGHIESQTMAEVDLSKPETQRGFSNLQMMDFLTGQVDRHQGNIFVDPETGQVSGIDNDLAFGRNQRGTDLRNNYGMPEQIDVNTAKAIIGMSEEQFLEVLDGQEGDYQHLEDDEKQAALERFRTARETCTEYERDGKLIETWDDSTFQESTKSLFGEDGQLAPGTSSRFFREDNLISRSVLDLTKQQNRG
jgi:hypothetical protein